jgi:hypothetical protein
VSPRDLLGGPPPTLLPVDPATAELAVGADPVQVARTYPASSAAWAALADRAFAHDSVVESYAYARTGYHRGLDALRRAGWKGHGPIPGSHPPNRGFLGALAGLARAAEAIGEHDEAHRCQELLREADGDVDPGGEHGHPEGASSP